MSELRISNFELRMREAPPHFEILHSQFFILAGEAGAA
jgi:hypothetical protein